MERLYISLSPETLAALHRLAERHRRTQREEAAGLIVERLRRHARLAARRPRNGARTDLATTGQAEPDVG